MKNKENTKEVDTVAQSVCNLLQMNKNNCKSHEQTSLTRSITESLVMKWKETKNEGRLGNDLS